MLIKYIFQKYYLIINVQKTVIEIFKEYINMISTYSQYKVQNTFYNKIIRKKTYLSNLTLL